MSGRCWCWPYLTLIEEGVVGGGVVVVGGGGGVVGGGGVGVGVGVGVLGGRGVRGYLPKRLRRVVGAVEGTSRAGKICNPKVMFQIVPNISIRYRCTHTNIEGDRDQAGL